MKFTFKLFLIFSIFMISMSFTYANTEDLAKEMFRASGTYDMMDDYLDQIISAYKNISLDVPDKYWTKLKKKMDMTELLDKMIPIYAKHFTENDLKTIIKFYKTPEGKKMIEKTPIITKEVMEISMEWGMKLGKEIADELQKEGY